MKLVTYISVFLNTPAHYATDAGKAECFNCLLQHDADLNALNEKRETPLESARRAGKPLLMEKASKSFIQIVS